MSAPEVVQVLALQVDLAWRRLPETQREEDLDAFRQQVRTLLAYSTGLDDQEFIVAYETDDLAVFQDLVTALRDTEGRRYTLRDQPILTAIHRPLEEALRQLG